MTDSPIADDCPSCGSAKDARSFVTYEASPNGSQRDTAWCDSIPERLYAIVCTECGEGIAAIDASDGSGPDAVDASAYRVDEELE